MLPLRKYFLVGQKSGGRAYAVDDVIRLRAGDIRKESESVFNRLLETGSCSIDVRINQLNYHSIFYSAMNHRLFWERVLDGTLYYMLLVDRS